jgi:hypothetical protein
MVGVVYHPKAEPPAWPICLRGNWQETSVKRAINGRHVYDVCEGMNDGETQRAHPVREKGLGEKLYPMWIVSREKKAGRETTLGRTIDTRIGYGL